MCKMMREKASKAKAKVAKTMAEFKEGELKSGGGRPVTSRKQALAIALSQARRRSEKK